MKHQSTMSDAMELTVGDRVEDARGQRGTVRYVGPVATSKDASTVYYGIEWDEWGRGLNDGSVTLPSGERVVYFEGPAPRVVKSATEFKCSFVKKSKLLAEMKCATLLEKLRERYDPSAIGGQRLAASVARGRDVVIAGEVGTALGSQRPIELVGVDKLRTKQTLATIEKISLAQCHIKSLGISERGELGRLTPQIIELDLSLNLLRSWSTVFDVLEELPLLETIILTGNRLVYDEVAAQGHEGMKIFPQVKVLVLNQTAIKWKDVADIAHRHFPQLTELYFAANDVTDEDLSMTNLLVHDSSWLASLQVLDLSDNKLSSWNAMEAHIGRAFSHLKQFVGNGNEISSLSSDQSSVFQELLSLSLNENRIDSWTSIDALNRYPKLDTFRFMRNPLTSQMGAGEARAIIVARAEYLQIFNGSPIRQKERVDAEQMYLKRILHEIAAAGNSDIQKTRIRTCHPRFRQLCDRYPEVVAIANAALRGVSGGGPSTLGSSLIQVKIVPMSMNAMTFDPLSKRMPQNMKISQLKVLVEKKFGIVVSDQLLSFRADAKSMPIPLEDENCELSYYGLQDGAEILVNDA